MVDEMNHVGAQKGRANKTTGKKRKRIANQNASLVIRSTRSNNSFRQSFGSHHERLLS